MNIVSVGVTYGRTINLGNYNSAKLEATVAATLEDGDVVSEVMNFCWETAKQSVKEQAIPLVKPKVEEKENY